MLAVAVCSGEPAGKSGALYCCSRLITNLHGLPTPVVYGLLQRRHRTCRQANPKFHCGSSKECAGFFPATCVPAVAAAAHAPCVHANCSSGGREMNGLPLFLLAYSMQEYEGVQLTSELLPFKTMISSLSTQWLI